MVSTNKDKNQNDQKRLPINLESLIQISDVVPEKDVAAAEKCAEVAKFMAWYNDKLSAESITNSYSAGL